jgi:serine/threonine-protein kinase RsbW
MPDDPPAADEGLPCLRLAISADPVAVRAALATLCDTLILRTLAEDARGTAELVIAEALNNIVEHAYGEDGGEIEIVLRRAPGALFCQIADRGRPMPGGTAPAGRLPAADTANPPEGGFGWYLIRSLSQDLRYRREDDWNRLSFSLETGTGGKR